MKRRLLLGLLAASLYAGLLPAWAGPLRERILERLQERRLESSDEQALLEPGDTEKAHTPAAARVLRDVAYGSDPRQRMDVYLPPQRSRAPQEGKASERAPVIVMVHGGGWRHGDKGAGAVVNNKVARWVAQGFVFISVNNRLLPDADPLEQAHDVARALATAQGRAASWGADPTRFILMGHSAGAHLVALLNAAPSLAAAAGASAWLGTVALDSAALDVAPIMQARHYRLYDPAFGTDPLYWRAVSPLQQLQAAARPMLLVCSSRREDSCAQADGFAAHAAALGVRAQVLRQDLSHGDINQTLGQPGAYTQAVEAFMAALDTTVAQRLAPR